MGLNTVIKYLKEAKENYVIMKNGKPIRFSDGEIVIYGDLEEANGDCCSDEKVITEYDYIISETK